MISLSGTGKECILEDKNENALDSLLVDFKGDNTKSEQKIENKNNRVIKRNRDLTFGALS